MTTTVHRPPPLTVAVRRAGLRERPGVLAAATSVIGVAVAVLVGRDGSPGWQVARVLVTLAVTASAVAVVQRGSRWASGLTAVVVGLVATAIGVGIGGPHVAKGGPIVPTVAGLLAVSAGLIVLIGGTSRLVGSVRRWRGVAVVLVTVAVVVPVTYAVGVAVAATNVPRVALGRETPAERGRAYRDVLFPAPDGVTLSGWYVPSRNGAAVVLLHGAGSTRSSVLDHAAVLARHGYGVLLFDARGHGRSGGRAMDFGWYGDEDIGGAVTFLASQSDVTGAIGAVGLSMGGEQALGAAAADPRIGAVVAEGATNRVAADRAWLDDVYGFRGWLQQQIDRLTYAVTDVLTSADPPIALRAAVAATASPVFLITAGDVPDEARAAQYIASAAPASVEIWEVTDAGHTDGLATDPAGWEARVIGFLDRALDPAAPS